MITKDFLKGGKQWRIAWKFNISSLDPDTEQWVYVDAATGEIIRTINRVLSSNVSCTAQTKYSGTLAITGDSFSGGYRLRETKNLGINQVNVETLNYNNSYSNATDFINTGTSFVNGTWATYSQDQTALDAHWAAEQVLDYWWNRHSRNSIDDNGLPVISYVHYSAIDNAFWDGSIDAMIYGDPSSYNSFSSLDICGHEIGHGITQYTANLSLDVNNYPESVALNEGFSDIWGACVDAWSPISKQPWLIGDEIFNGTSYSCLRNLSNPADPTTAEGSHPDTYHGLYWSSSGDPHTNSTVLSHWFYLVAQGGNGWNNGQTSNASIGSGYHWTVNGIGIEKAEKIAYLAESGYLYNFSTATYQDVQYATIQAARELYCDNSPEIVAVTNAWYAVGIGSQNTTQMSVSGPSTMCVTASYTLLDQPYGVTSIAWSEDNSSIATINSSGIATSGSNTGTVTFIATVYGGLGCSTIIPINTPVTVLGTAGLPQINLLPYETFIPSDPSSFYYNPVCALASTDINLDVTGATTVNWSKYTSAFNVNWSQTGNDLSFYFFAPSQTAAFRVDASNSCGTATEYFAFNSIDCSGGGGDPCGGENVFLISPNPATNRVIIVPDTPPPCDELAVANNINSTTIPISKKTDAGSSGNKMNEMRGNNRKVASVKPIIKSIKVYDMAGKLYKSQLYTGTNRAEIDISQLVNGVYIISIGNGKTSVQKKLIIQH